MTNDKADQADASQRVYVLVAVDKQAVREDLQATVRACLQTVMFEDAFFVADVTDLVVSRILGGTGESRLRGKLLRRVAGV